MQRATWNMGWKTQNNTQPMLQLTGLTMNGIFRINIHGQVTFANPVCLRILGYSGPDQIIGMDLQTLFYHARFDENVLANGEFHIYRTLARGINLEPHTMDFSQVNHQFEAVFRKTDGTGIPVKYSYYPMITNGSVTGIAFAFIETPYRKAENWIEIEQHRFSSTHLRGVGFWEWDGGNRNILLINEGWERLLGYKAGEVSSFTNNQLIELVHPDDLHKISGIRQQWIDNMSDVFEFEIRFRHTSGNWTWLVINGAVSQWNEDRKPVLMNGSYQDITKQKHLEYRLNHLEDQNQALISAIPDLVFMINPDGIILEHATRAKEILSIFPKKTSGASIYAIMDDLEIEKIKTCNCLAMATGSLQSTRINIKMEDHSIRTFECRLAKSGLQEITLVMRDISEIARLEKTKSDFIDRAAHELNTPIATMLLMVNLLENENGMAANEEYWDLLKTEIKHQQLLVQDMISMSRLNQGQYPKTFMSLDIHGIILQTIQSMTYPARNKNVSIELDTQVDKRHAPLLVRGDETALSQVFINLVENAIKYSLSSGKVIIRLQNFDDCLIITIIDNGIGIPCQDLPLLFNRFFRGSNAIENEIAGMGIGLTIVRSILEMHGGVIQVQSELNKGSQFIVSLPLVMSSRGSANTNKFI